MIVLPSGARIWLARGYTDMRKGMDGLAMLARQVLAGDPFGGALFAFRGLLQVDGYAGFGRLVAKETNEGPTLAFCWTHTRRKFHDVFAANTSPLAHEALQRIGALYAIEADIRGQTAEHRKQMRQQRSRPLVEALHTRLTGLLERLSGRSTLAQAIRYALNHWNGLILFLDGGRFELDTNIVERAMRPVALGRTNARFAGADSGAKHWAIVATLIQTAKLNDVEPLAWLTDVLKRVVSGQTKRNQLDIAGSVRVSQIRVDITLDVAAARRLRIDSPKGIEVPTRDFR